MREKYIHIDVLFGQMQPELLRQNLLASETVEGVLLRRQANPEAARRTLPNRTFLEAERMPYLLHTQQISEACYLHAARGLQLAQDYTEDELRQRYWHLHDFMEAKRAGGILCLLADYARQVLRYQSSVPLCRQEYLPDWRARTLALGQDLFTCAGLAAMDVQDHCVTRSFHWPAVIRTDHIELQRMLARGISENHFHLNGSTQMFPLAWCYLMNHPDRAGDYFQTVKFQENLKSGLSYGVRDNRISWRERIYEAAWIRAYLFQLIQQNGYCKEYCLKKDYQKFAVRMDKHRVAAQSVQRLRLTHGTRFRQRDGSLRCLDYALSESAAQKDVLSSPWRILTGERELLYQCFRHAFSGAFSPEACDVFYLYLLFKLRFREELIQANGRAGFRNFANYETRKAHVWGDCKEYWEESYRLSVAGALSEDDEGCAKVKSMELRVMPKDSPARLKASILQCDLGIQHGVWGTSGPPRPEGPLARKIRLGEEQNENASYFYVLHFAKQPDPRIRNERLQRLPPGIVCRESARNGDVRQKAERQAKATAAALERSSYLCSRIRGIDACNHEIGCRPETFATAFRYLKMNFPRIAHVGNPKEVRYWPQLGMTYHAGEDFLDLTDGLRAIDEAISFLHLERGDRLGHALALGMMPQPYYQAKHHSVVLPAQDLLDNITWLLFRSLEWGVAMPDSLRTSLQNKAQELLRRIYGNGYIIANQSNPKQLDFQELSLQDYYQSWKLRGDDPTVYWEAFHDERYMERLFSSNCSDLKIAASAYQRAKIDDADWVYWKTAYSGQKPVQSGAVSTNLRTVRKLQILLYHYHYDLEARLCGQRTERFQISADYISLVQSMQERMMAILMTKGIAIECNPSSNQLIGIFGGYENHPIFRLNHYGLDLPEFQQEKQQLRVSVNTDGQGIFDTSIENEYALLYSGLQSRTSADGEQLIDNDTIRCYLNHVREMGNDMVFPRSIKRQQRRLNHEKGGLNG